jgi:AcrR family transcriptional regulator
VFYAELPMVSRERMRRGGRSERIRRQVAQACIDLLTEGDVELRPADVAERSRVSRATIYRWWPTRAALLEEALAEHTGHRLDPPDSGDWESDVRALVRQLADFFSDPVEVAQNAIMAGGRHPDYDHAVLRHYAPLFDAWRNVVERARARGELYDGVDADTVILTLVAPLLMVPLLFHRAPTESEVERLAGLLVAATVAR